MSTHETQSHSEPGADDADDDESEAARLEAVLVALHRDAWASASANYFEFPNGGHGLTILGKPVMESWESPYMSARQHGHEPSQNELKVA